MILVTGAAGLVGQELVAQLLASGRQVRAIIHRVPLPFQTSALQQVQGDILDVVAMEEAMRDIEEVYHCAAVITFHPKRRRELFKINVEGTANVVNLALDAGVKKMVHVSSVAAIGRMRENEPVQESLQWSEKANNSRYGYSKYLGEMEVWRGIGEGLNAVIVNPAIILGEGDWNNGSSKLFRQVYHEFPWYSDGINGFVDVKDVARAMIGLMNSPVSGQRFIISAEDKSYQDLFTLIAQSFGKKPPHKKITPALAALVWRLEIAKGLFSGEEPLITRETAQAALAKVHFDNSRLITVLPEFRYTPLEESVQRICASIQQKLNTPSRTFVS